MVASILAVYVLPPMNFPAARRGGLDTGSKAPVAWYVYSRTAAR